MPVKMSIWVASAGESVYQWAEVLVQEANDPSGPGESRGLLNGIELTVHRGDTVEKVVDLYWTAFRIRL